MTITELTEHGTEPERACLGTLIDTLGPAELAEHGELAPIFEAAKLIVYASYSNRTSTPRIGRLSNESEPLVGQLLDRYRDVRRGGVAFPMVCENGIVVESLNAADDVFDFTLGHRRDTKTLDEYSLFSSFQKNYDRIMDGRTSQ